MLDYVQQLCESEGMSVAPGVLPLVVRAGGGSPRDTLSLLDQLIAGSEGESIEYERAVALLGYTHAALLDEVVDAIGAVDAASAFAAVDRVVQTGQDPRRFVEDLLERLRDLIIVAATSPDAAAAVLRGTPQEELDRMSVQASVFGSAELSRCADIVNAALTEMTGATSPRLHLELMIARMLVPASDATDRGALARVERLERRVGVAGSADSAPAADVSGARPAAQASVAPAVRATSASSSGSADPVAARATQAEPERTAAESAAAAWSAHSPNEHGSRGEPEAAPAETTKDAPSESQVAPAEPSSAVAQAEAFAAAAAAKKGQTTGAMASSDWATPGVTDEGPASPVGPVTTQQVRDAWPEILESVAEASRIAWAVVYTATVRSLDGDVLSLSFPSANDVDSFRGTPGATDAASEVLRQAIVDLLGIRVKFVAKPAGFDGSNGPGPGGSRSAGPSGASGSGDRSGDSRSGGSDPAEARRGGPGSGGGASDGAPGVPSPVGARAATGAAGGSAARSRRPSGSSPSGPSQSGAAASGANSSGVVGWATAVIPGSSATAVLERPQPEKHEAERDDDAEHSETKGAVRSVDGQGLDTQGLDAQGLDAQGLDAQGLDAQSLNAQDPDARNPSSQNSGVRPSGTEEPDDLPPDDEEPPFPDEYPGDPTLSSLSPAAVAARSRPVDPPSTAQAADEAAPPPALAADAAPPQSPEADDAAPSSVQSTAQSPSTGGNPNRRDAGERTGRPSASVGFREPARYGEAVVRELLGAKFVEEQQITPPPGTAGRSGWSR
jgi:DNA polymerase-3 subunit gamma/tau